MGWAEVDRIEADLHRASAAIAAAVAFAALVRLGELGSEGSLAFQEHLRKAAADPGTLEKALAGIDGLT